MAYLNNSTWGNFVLGTDYIDIIENNNEYVTVDARAGDDVISNTSVSRTLDNITTDTYRFPNNSSINGGAGRDSLNNTSSNTTLIGGDGDDTINNWDSTTSPQGKKSYHVSNEVLIIGGNGNDSISNGSNFAVTIDGGSGNDYISNEGNYAVINGGDGKDTIQNSVNQVVIEGGADNDRIVNTSHYSLLDGGVGNDTVITDRGNVTINGGAGNDNISLGSDAANNLIQYKSGEGNDKIYGFNATSTLQIGGGKGTYSTVESGDNIIVTVGKGKITIVGGADLDELNIDGAKVLTVTNSTKSPVTAEADVKFINAAKRTKAVNITGNKLANSIVGGSKNDTISGGYGADTLSGGKGNDILDGGRGNDSISGGAGDDTITGGKGNDSLWGNAGADTFIYAKGDGKDIIYGFDNKDTLSLDNLEFTSATYSKKSKAVTLKVDDGSITLKNFTATTFHINDDTYKISGSKFVKQK